MSDEKKLPAPVDIGTAVGRILFLSGNYLVRRFSDDGFQGDSRRDVIAMRMIEMIHSVRASDEIRKEDESIHTLESIQ